MEKITAVIITQDEERNIGRCLASLQGVADEIVVVDSGSTDRTEAICAEHGVRFERHPWAGYSEQKNYANSLATSPWILSIDADEALSPALRERLLKIKEEGLDRGTVYSFNRLTNYCGRWIRHCGWYPDVCARMWRNDGSVRWDGVVHEQLHIGGPTPVCRRIDGDLLHYSYRSVSDHLQRMARYAPLGAEKALSEGKRCGVASLWFRPLWTFLRVYIFKGGFRDGVAGFVVARLSATYTLVKYATLYRMTHEAAD